MKSQSSPQKRAASDEATPSQEQGVPDLDDDHASLGELDQRPPAPPPLTSGESELDRRLEVLDGYLFAIQRPVRLQFYGWLSAQSAIMGVSIGMAATSEGADRMGAILRASVSVSSIGLMLLVPQPGRYASARYRKLPSGTLNEKRAKLEAGQQWLYRQAHSDRLATSAARHLLGAGVALAVGTTLILAYDDGLRAGIVSTLGILLVSELQIATRSDLPRICNRNYAGSPLGPVQLTVAPFVSHRAQGLSLVGRF